MGHFTTVDVDDIPVGMINRVNNGGMLLCPEGTQTIGDAATAFVSYTVLTQSGNVQTSQLADAGDAGQSRCMRITQSSATAQRFGIAQTIPNIDCQDLRTLPINCSHRQRFSLAARTMFALLEWDGTADASPADPINDWTSTAYVPGQFFKSTFRVLNFGYVSAIAGTWFTAPYIPFTGGAALNNLVYVVWTEGECAQNSTMDIGLIQVAEGDVQQQFDHRNRQVEQAVSYPVSAAMAPVIQAQTLVAAQVALGVREALTANRTYTYNPAGGSDFTTLAAAVAAIQGLDPRGYTITVNGPATTTAVTERLIVPQDFGWGTNEQYEPRIHFNLANCDFSNTTNSCIVVIGGRAKVTAKSIASASATEASVQCADGGELWLIPGSFGASTTGHIQAANGYINLPSAYAITGGAPYHYVSESANGLIQAPNATVTLSGTPAFSNAFAIAGELSNIKTFASTVFSGAATGMRWKETGGGRITANDPNDNLDAIFPGNSAGSGTLRGTAYQVVNGANRHTLTSAATALRTLGIPDLSGIIAMLEAAQTFTAVQVVAVTTAGDVVTLRSTDDGASGGPNLVLDRASATPAINDSLGGVYVRGRDSNGNLTGYGEFMVIITDPADGSEDGAAVINAIVNGVNTEHIRCTGGNVTSPGSLTANRSTAIPAGGANTLGLKATSTANFGVFFGSGAPTLSAAKGSLYLRSDGSTTNDRAYINTDGATTWTALTTAA